MIMISLNIEISTNVRGVFRTLSYTKDEAQFSITIKKETPTQVFFRGRPEMFWKYKILKILEILKNLQQNTCAGVLITLQAWRSTTLLKRDSSTGVFLHYQNWKVDLAQEKEQFQSFKAIFYNE